MAALRLKPALSEMYMVKRYAHIWTIEGWSAYLNQKCHSPLKKDLQTGQLYWKLKLTCNLDAARKWACLRVMAELELEPETMDIAEVCCFLLGLESEATARPRRQTLSQHGNSRAILMDVPVENVLPTQKLDEIKISIQLDIKKILNTRVSHYIAHLPLAIEMTSLPKEVFDLATTDVAIVADDKVIPVHRSVLADSSPIFESLLSAASWKKLELTGLRFQTAKELVSYVYTKREPNFHGMDASDVFDLLEAAETYGLEELKQHALDRIASNQNPASAIDLLLQADKKGNLFVKKMVLLFIKNNKQFFSIDKFGRLRNDLDLMAEILDVICS